MLLFFVLGVFVILQTNNFSNSSKMYSVSLQYDNSRIANSWPVLRIYGLMLVIYTNIYCEIYAKHFTKSFRKLY